MSLAFLSQLITLPIPGSFTLPSSFFFLFHACGRPPTVIKSGVGCSVVTALASWYAIWLLYKWSWALTNPRLTAPLLAYKDTHHHSAYVRSVISSRSSAFRTAAIAASESDRIKALDSLTASSRSPLFPPTYDPALTDLTECCRLGPSHSFFLFFVLPTMPASPA